MSAEVLTADARADWQRHGRNLEYPTVCWNFLEAVASGTGILTVRIALVASGLMMKGSKIAAFHHLL